MTQADKATLFQNLHLKGDPIVLYNIWDAGTARAVVKAGAKAVATGSASVAGAQGYPDGQDLPLELLLTIASRIAASVDVPFTVDFEGGYAVKPEGVAANVTKVIEAGAIGINFEDQIVGGKGLHDIATQCDRIRAIRRAADAAGIPLVINARTDLFLKERDTEKQGAFIAEAKERGAAYEEAGASCFFVPGLLDGGFIADMCETVSLPVNVMKIPGALPLKELAALGVARISYGPVPYFTAMATMTDIAKDLS